MNHRRTLILRLYRAEPNASDPPLGVCEDPKTGLQLPFRTPEELWSIVQAEGVGSGSARSAGSQQRRRKGHA